MACANAPVESSLASRARKASRATEGNLPRTMRARGAVGGAMGTPLTATVRESIVPTADANLPAKNASVLRSNARLTDARVLSSSALVAITPSSRRYAAARSARVT